MKTLFGTDGLRAVAGQYPLDDLTIRILGRALAGLLEEEKLEPRVLIGRDTRESGPWIEKALAAGIGSAGGESVSAGIVPTSAVSFLTCKHRFSAGIVISASHNPFRDNGIKIFSAEGIKIPDAWEIRLERAILKGPGRGLPAFPESPLEPRPELVDDYEDFLMERFRDPGHHKEVTVVLDCSNGASSVIAPTVFFRLGFRVIPIFNGPDGHNINRRCGSLHPHNLARHVVASRADVGIAYDGDADRALWVDETGKILNGDHTLFVQARSMLKGGRLKGNTVVATTMSNMGLEKGLRDMGVELIRTRVGDKYVLDKMRETGANLGGEQSGHTIFLDDCPTGDGILTSLRMLEAMLAAGVTFSRLTGELKEFPQVLHNVRVREKADFGQFPEIVRTIDEIRADLAGTGRLDVRYSGTEPLARVMIEGEDLARIEAQAARLTSVIAKYLRE
ncbi:MAG: phosphoglucosamine mutase [Candidatus Aminicenantes bacterium]|nr:phosphoglucosamine mutase [Candidatus Aminicenantes bacterium]